MTQDDLNIEITLQRKCPINPEGTLTLAAEHITNDGLHREIVMSSPHTKTAVLRMHQHIHKLMEGSRQAWADRIERPDRGHER